MEFRKTVSQKSVLLIIGGGVAAYKSLELIRLLSRSGVNSRVILTRAGSEFVTPLSASALSGEKTYSELFDLTDEAEMGHIQLSRSADLVVVCPATADLIAKAANGHANDLASTTLLATDKPVLMAPAMNVRMWEHPAVRRNVETLRADGVAVMEPDVGDMACGEFGPGRLPEPERICEQILVMLGGGARQDLLAGKRVIVTAGPTREPLDPVRYLSNHSSGRQGYAIARALADLGADVRLVSGPVKLDPPRNVELIPVETAREMLAAVKEQLPADAFVSVAAVADWRPAKRADDKLKIKGRDDALAMQLVENPDILRHISNKKRKRPRLVVGFAAETTDVEQHAAAKLERKGCDWIVANDVSGDVMGGSENEIVLMTPQGAERWERMDKDAVARRLAERIAVALSSPLGPRALDAAE